MRALARAQALGNQRGDVFRAFPGRVGCAVFPAVGSNATIASTVLALVTAAKTAFKEPQGSMPWADRCTDAFTHETDGAKRGACSAC
ncbi:MAG: hypothetical protein ACI8PT_000802 [Gammaproteobacteria bacterium]|jgi:hypothetical protein